MWLDFLSEYDFDIKHIKGKEKKVVDTLNRRVHEIHATNIRMYKSYLSDKILEVANSDQCYMDINKNLQQGKLQQKFEGYELKENVILMYRHKVYVPNDQELKNMLLSEMHKFPYVGNLGYQKTIAAVKNKYYCPGMKKEVVDFIARCLECQKVKDEHRNPTGFLQPFPIPEWK
jgi:hypothetical protein